MHDKVKIALKSAIMNSLPVLQPLTIQYTEPHLVWTKSGGLGWHGEYKERPSLLNVYMASRKSLEEFGSEFLQVFRTHYPEYGTLIGFPGLGLMNILHDPSYILSNVLSELWNRYETFNCGEDAVDAIVQEFEEFIDLPTVRIRYMAQLLNYHMDRQRIELVSNMIIRQLTEKELSEIEGGSIWSLGFIPKHILGVHEYVLEGEYEEFKIFGDQSMVDSPVHNRLRQNLDKAILSLRTFKEGRTGYDSLRFKAVKFCPVPLPVLTYGDLHVPVGQYTVAEEEIEALQHHAALIFSPLDPAMEMACSRLADAQTRLRAQDCLVDAVIGLEALLLAGLRNEDRRGELRYRFALHYSTLFPSPEERYGAFCVAKDMYDLRSTIAHGGMPKQNNCRLGVEKVTLSEAAQRACKMLRDVLAYFLHNAGVALYKHPQYWERGYFGLPPDI